MMSTTDLSMPPELERAIYGFMASHVLFAGDSIGIFSALAAGEPVSAPDLAARLDLHPVAVDRFLTAAVSLGLLERTQDEYAMKAEVRPFLDRASPRYCGGFFPLFERVSTRSFAHLKDALRDGLSQWPKIAGDVSSPFELFAKDRDALDRFAHAMWSLGYSAAEELVRDPLFAECGHLVDVGGGSGSFSVAALERWPEMRATVFDLPSMREIVARKGAEHGLEHRLSFIAGDFFRDEIPAADACALGYVLSDWEDVKAIAILTATHRAIRPGGRILILDRLFDEDRSGPTATALMDLCMMLEPGGRHRTSSEYRSLLERAGFAFERVRRSSGEKHMIIGRRAG